MASTQHGVTPETTVNQLLEIVPESIVILDELGIDSCCGGGLSLKAAALDSNVDPDSLLTRLRELRRE